MIYAGLVNGAQRGPGYLDTKKGRVAFIACASTFSMLSPAGVQRPDMKGRPGLNPLRFLARETLTTTVASSSSWRRPMAGVRVELDCRDWFLRSFSPRLFGQGIKPGGSDRARCARVVLVDDHRRDSGSTAAGRLGDGFDPFARGRARRPRSTGTVPNDLRMPPSTPGPTSSWATDRHAFSALRNLQRPADQ